MYIEVNELKQIAILNVANELGIQIKSNKAMCFYGHDKKTPSFSLDVRRNLWHCFGCGAGGDTIKLVQEFLHIDFKLACSWLAERFNLASEKHQKGKIASEIKKVDKLRAVKQECDSADIEIYEWLIKSCSMGSKGYDYLVNKRGFSEETIKEFNIKDIEKPPQRFWETRRKWGAERLIKCGLAKETSHGKMSLIWWDHTVLFPFYDFEGRIVYIQGRSTGNGEPRYVNLQGVPTEIFNLRVLRNLRKGDFIYICEGVTDVLSAYESGLNAVGIIGAFGFKSEWVYRFTDFRIRIIPDSDLAGSKFAERIENAFKDIGKPTQIIQLPPGKDFTEYIRF